MLSIGLLVVGLGLTSIVFPEFQASTGDGTLGTFTVTALVSTHQNPYGTFVSANRQVVVKNIELGGNLGLKVGTTVPAILPSSYRLSWDGGAVYRPGRDSAAVAGLVFIGGMILACVAYLAWSVRRIIRFRRTFPVSA